MNNSVDEKEPDNEEEEEEDVSSVSTPPLTMDKSPRLIQPLPLPENDESPLEELTSRSFLCPTCSLHFDLASFFLHEQQVHNNYLCVYCINTCFSHAKELLLHLEWEHPGIPPQNFVNGQDFLARGGSSSFLHCVECNKTFTTSPQSFSDSSDIQPLNSNSLRAHAVECRKRTGMCPKCGAFFILSLLGNHIANCKETDSVHNKRTLSVPVTKEKGVCTFCGKIFPPTKVWSHMRVCHARNKIKGGSTNNSSPSLSTPPPSSPPKHSFPEDSIESRLLGSLTSDIAGGEDEKEELPSLSPLPPPLSTSPTTTPLPVFTSSKRAPVPKKYNSSFIFNTPKSRKPKRVDSGGPLGRPPKSPASSSAPPHSNHLNHNAAELPSNSSSLTQAHSYSEQMREYEESRPRRSAKKLNSADFMYESLGKRSYQKSTSMNNSSPEEPPSNSTPSSATPPGRSRKRGRSSLSSNHDHPDHSNLPQEPGSVRNNSQFQNQVITKGEQPPESSEESYEEEIEEEIIVDPSELSPLPELKLDPLLLEPDPSKRLELLILELFERICLPKNENSLEYGPILEIDQELLSCKEKGHDFLLSRLVESSSPQCLYCRQVQLIRVDVRQLVIHLFRAHDWGDTEQAKEFKLKLLRDVFHSPKFVFSFSRIPEEGEIQRPIDDSPCECLICGFQALNQKQLFPHWRRIHRGIAMNCAMCSGRFLFAGALFSHICLGSTLPLSEYTIPTSSSTSAPYSIGRETEELSHVTSAGDFQTIVLRYQCGFCPETDQTILPTFFNYMVHLRRDHNRCELCLETSNSQLELEHHMKKHKLNHFCWKCNVTYCAKPNFMTHLFWKHGTESEICTKCLYKKWPHVYHFCLPPRYFPCETCGAAFSKAKVLTIHKRLHTGEGLRRCPKLSCPEKFISKKLLEKHIEADHSDNTREGDELKAQHSTFEAEKDAEENGTKKEEERMDEECGSPSLLSTEDAGKSFNEAPEMKTPDEKDLTVGVKAEEAPLPPKIDENQELNVKVYEDGSKPNDFIKESEAEGDVPNTMEEAPVPAKVGETPMDLDNEPQPLQTDGNGVKEEEERSKTPEKSAPIEEGPNPSQSESQDTAPNETPSKVEGTIPRKSKKSRKRFDIAQIRGPNLSEEESDGSSYESSDEPPSPVPKDTNLLDNSFMGSPPTSKALDEEEDVERPNVDELKQDSEGGVKEAGDLPNKEIADSNVKLNGPLTNKDLALSSDDEEKEDVVENIKKDDQGSEVGVLPKGSSSPDPPLRAEEKKDELSNEIPGVSAIGPELNSSFLDSDLSGLEHLLEDADLDEITNTMNLSKDDKELDDFGSMSPLLPPLDSDFSLPEIPTFEDNTLPEHILRENALFSVIHEHDYTSPHHKRKLSSSPIAASSGGVGWGHHHSYKRHDSSKRKKERRMRKRERMRSRSSSTSSNSSCSTCGRCSTCSSSSSSSSESGNEERRLQRKNKKAAKHSKVKLAKVTPPKVLKKRGPKPKNPSAEPKIKRPVGRPPKKDKDKDFTPKRPYKKKASKSSPFGEGNSAAPLINLEAEEDLVTSDSDSELLFHQRQLTEVYGHLPAEYDEVWTMGNERYLLKELRGVKDVEELRPKVSPPRLQVRKVKRMVRKRRKKIKGYKDESGVHYSLLQRGPESKLKVRNVPIRPIIVKRESISGGSNPARPLEVYAKKSTPHNSLSTPPSPSVNSKQFVNNNVNNNHKYYEGDHTGGEVKRGRGRPGRKPGSKNKQLVPQPSPTSASYPQYYPEGIIERTDELYCYCQSPHDNVSQMIGCDDENCKFQWFHFECVGILVPPKGQWYCQDCRSRRRAERKEQQDAIDRSYSMLTSGGGELGGSFN